MAAVCRGRSRMQWPWRRRAVEAWSLEASGHLARLRLAAVSSPTTAGAPPAPQIRSHVKRDVFATFAVFAANGAVIGSWTSRIPALKLHLDVGLSVLGLVFLCMGLGSLISMPFTGFILKHVSTKVLGIACAVGSCLTLVGLTHLHNVVAFSVFYAFAGLCYGAWDVTMNVHANAVEIAYGRTIMPALHGAWGAGMLVGAAAGFLFTRAQITLEAHITIALLILMVVAIGLMLLWLDLRDQHVDPPGKERLGRRAMISAALVIGVMVMCSTIGEGSASDWLALHMVEDHHTTPAIGTSVYVIYALFLTAGRLGGSVLIDRLGRVNAIRVSGFVTFVGVVLVIVAPNLAVSYVGTALWGLGLAVVFPAAVSAAGELGGAYASQTISTVVTIAYGGFLVGPPILGFLGDQFGLSKAFWVVAVLALGYAALAGSARSRRPATEHDRP
jgi:predicted MFS family arabinose efflux permease